MADEKTTSVETEADVTELEASATPEDEARDDTDAPEVDEAEIVEESADDAVPEPDPTPEAAPEPPAPQVIETRRGPGFVPLVLGGVVAAGLGWGATYLGYLPGPSSDGGATAALEEAMADQSSAMDALTARADALQAEIAALPPAPEAVDLTPITDQLAALSAQMETSATTLSGLSDRVGFLETLPASGGEGDGGAAMAAAVARLQAELQEQTAAMAAQQAEIAAQTEALDAAATAAETRIAAAEARAEERVGNATAQAALGQLRIAAATGAPFASALADVVAGTDVEVPEALQAAAETGLPTLEELQGQFPAMARAALPVAIRETAESDAGSRFMAFLQSQVGGRSLEAREGDDPDAILSRAEAALRGGDLATVLSEIAALPEPAQAAMASWTEAAGLRLSASDALDSFAAALDGAGDN